MTQRINWFITDQNVTVNYNGQTHIVKRSDPLADDLIRAIKEDRKNDIPNLVSVAQAMEHKSKGDVMVRDGELLIKGVRVPAELARKIQKFMDEGLPYQPLIKFAENLQNNPSFRAVNELFQFLEKNDHPFTENGNFIAYKRVRGTFKDIHSNTFDNSPGTVVEISRNQVDENSDRTCSHGLHVANWNYAHTQFASSDPFTDVMLEVEVNPADVVAIPSDYNQSKMRVCKYKVLGVVKSEFTDSSLRITNPDYSFENENNVEGDNCCTLECGDCGHQTCQCEENYCKNCYSDDCDGECENVCDECGAFCESDYNICVDCECEAELEEGEEEIEEEVKEEDRYPFEDEFEV